MGAASGELTVSYLGHGTVLLEMDGLRLLTDPVLRTRIGFLRRHGPLPDPVVIEDLSGVLVSHLHLDHLDRASLRMLPRETPVVVPPGTGAVLRRQRIVDLRELSPGDSVQIGEVTVTATPAAHTARRYPWGRKAGASGYLLRGSSNVYFAGDTGVFSEMAALSGDLDLALLPIWGWGPRLPNDHLSPKTAALALRLLEPRVAIPIHWGSFLPIGARRMYGHHLTDPPQAFVRYAKEYAPDVQTLVIAPGESATLRGNRANRGRGA